MQWWRNIRSEVLRGETSKREILRREGIHFETLRKILEHSEPPDYRMDKPRPKPKIGPYLEQIEQIIEDDKQYPKKQLHTAKRTYHRIKAMGYPRILKQFLRCLQVNMTSKNREVRVT